MVIQSTNLYKRHRKKVRKVSFNLYSLYFKKAFALITMVAIALLIFPYDLLISGEELFEKMAIKLNFKVEEISIIGAEKVSEEKLRKISGILLGSNIMTVDINSAKSNLETVAWIKKVTVERKLPKTILINIYEELPQAIFINRENYYLVNRLGKVIEQIDNPKAWPDLVTVNGTAANTNYENILQQLYEFQTIYKQIESLHYKEERRWDIKLKNNFILKLPATNIYQALKSFEQNFDMSVKLYKICIVDLRLIPDKIYLKIIN